MADKTLQTGARSIMNPDAPVLPLGPLGRDMAIQLVSGLFSGIPVIDREGTVLGSVTQANLQMALRRGEDLSMVHAEDVMTMPPVCLEEQMTMEEVASILIEENVMQLPVVRDGKFEGVITRWMVFGKSGLMKDPASLGVPGHSGQVNQSEPLFGLCATPAQVISETVRKGISHWSLKQRVGVVS